MAGNDYFLFDLPNFAPMAGGEPYRPLTGFEGLPGFNSPGLLGAGMQLAAGPAFQQLMGSAGLVPGGLSGRNVTDVIRDQAWTRAMQAGLARAAQADRSNYMATLQGVAAMTGTPFGLRQRMAAGEISDFLVGASPFLAEAMPETLDALGGSRGSAAVMAERVMRADRTRFDPATGRFDQTGARGGESAARLYRDVFEPMSLAETGGFRAGQYGQMYSELSRRGLLGSAESSLSSGELEQMRMDPAKADQLKAVDFEAVKRTLKGYTQALSAIRDVFGDMGRPDAPVQELFAAMDKMTRGGLAQMAPDQVANTVRQTRELAKLTGMSMGDVQMLGDHASARAMQSGLFDQHAAPVVGAAAAQGAMAFGGAFRAAGFTPGWGRMGADQMMQLDANLRTQAAASQSAQRMAVAARLGDSVGFKAGTTADAYLKAVKAGQTEFYDPATDSTRGVADVTGDAFTGMISQATGMSAGSVAAMLAQRHENTGAIVKYGLQDTVRKQQAADARKWFGQQFGSELGRLGLGDAQRDRAAAAATSALFGLGDADLADEGKRAAAVGRALEEAGAVRAGQGRASAMQMLGTVDQRSLSGRFAGYGGLVNLVTAHSDDRTRQAEAVRQQARDEADISRRFAHLGRGGLMQHFVDALKGVKTDDPDALGKVVGEALGGVPASPIKEGLRDVMSEYGRQIADVRDLQGKVRGAKDGPEKAAAEKALGARLLEYEKRNKDLDSRYRMLQDAVPPDAGVGSGDVRRAEGALAGAEKARDADVTKGIRDIKDPVERMKAWETFWGSHQGGMARDAFKDARGEFEGLLREGARGDAGAFGAKAKPFVERGEANQRRLKELADKYTGGDLGRLEAGEFDTRKESAAWQEVQNLGYERSVILDRMDKHRRDVGQGRRDAAGSVYGAMSPLLGSAGMVAGAMGAAAGQALEMAGRVKAEASSAQGVAADKGGASGAPGGPVEVSGTLKIEMDGQSGRLTGSMLGFKDAQVRGA